MICMIPMKIITTQVDIPNHSAKLSKGVIMEPYTLLGLDSVYEKDGRGKNIRGNPYILHEPYEDVH